MKTILNPSLLKLADRLIAGGEKQGFVPPQGMDPAMGGGGDPMAAMGGMPGMDPMAAGGGGAMPPPPPPGGDPMAGGGAAAPDLEAMITAAVQKAMAGGGMAGGAGGAGGIKPKIDVNVELMQIKKMLAKLVDSMGVPVPAQDMVATEEDLTAMAQGKDQASVAAGGGQTGGAIPPIDGMGGMQPSGVPGGGGGEKAGFDGNSFGEMGGDADALLQLLGSNY